MKKRIKIKWGNVGLLFTLIACIGLVVSDFIILATSNAGLTFYGATTGILAVMIINTIVEHFIDEMEE